MIKFYNLEKEKPYLLFKKKHDAAITAGQQNIEAISIASLNKENEVDSRYVNLNILDKNEFIFFTNYNSPKSQAFEFHNQISALFYWSTINVQIRMKAQIKKTSTEYNQEYFKKRSPRKNALAISSNQSHEILTFKDVIKKYNKVYKNMDLLICPEYWGGYSFTPYCFEFWEGHESRLNKRDLYELDGGIWRHSILQP